jgi:hypothetical protein
MTLITKESGFKVYLVRVSFDLTLHKASRLESLAFRDKSRQLYIQPTNYFLLFNLFTDMSFSKFKLILCSFGNV